MKKFTVTDQHLKLLDRIYIGYNDWTEFGAPEVDPKRPYGNSDVFGDIGEILGIEGEEEDSWGDKCFTEDQKNAMFALHKEMQYVLQVLVATRGVEAGTYEAGDYGINWKKVT